MSKKSKLYFMTKHNILLLITILTSLLIFTNCQPSCKSGRIPELIPLQIG